MTSSWHSLLVRIGERCVEYGGHADAEDHIETCFGSLTRDIPQYGEEILALLMQCVEELPHKDPLYGTLVGLINLESTDFVAKVVAHTHDGLQAALDSGNCNKMRTLMRFLTVLMSSNVIASGALIEVFETLVSSAATTIDEDGGNPSWQPRADFYVFCILASLPWGGLELAERVPDDLERVLAGVEAYLTLRKRCSEPSLSVFNAVGDGTEHTTDQEDFLEDLWSVIQGLMESGWKIESVPRPHLAFESRLVTGPSHEFLPLSCPDAPKLPPNPSDIIMGKLRQEAELLYPRRIGRLRIFPAAKTDEKIAPVDRFVVAEYLLDVLFYLNGCRKECAAYMVGLPVPFRYEYLMAEIVFSQLLLLPKPPFRLIYYTLVMVDLCKALPGAFPAVVAGAVRILFEKVGDLDVECRIRLVQWLSHHLSNFQFVWPWEEWSHVLDQPKWSPQRVFTQEVLDREVRLAYYDKIKEVLVTVIHVYHYSEGKLPSNYILEQSLGFIVHDVFVAYGSLLLKVCIHSLNSSPGIIELLPPRSAPYYKYGPDHMGEASQVEVAIATELIGMTRAKKSARDIQVYIEEKILPTQGQKMAIEVATQTFLYIGSKSFTHTVTILERYGTVLNKLTASNQDWHVAMVQAVAEFWKYSAQMTAIVIDRMMGYRIVSNLAIVAWVFSDENAKRFHTSDHVWEILGNAINKTNNRTTDLRKDVISIEKAVTVATAAVAKAQGKLDFAQQLSDTAESEDSKLQAKAKNDWAISSMRRAKEEESSSQESLEAKQALLARALREQEALFLSVYQNFARVLTDRLSKPSHTEGPIIPVKDENDLDTKEDPMMVDGDTPARTEEDNAEGDGERRNQRYGRSKNNGVPPKEEAQEEQQWCKCTLGQLRAISRHYATEVWAVMERLDAEVFIDTVHPTVLQTAFSGLRRHW